MPPPRPVPMNLRRQAEQQQQQNQQQQQQAQHIVIGKVRVGHDGITALPKPTSSSSSHHHGDHQHHHQQQQQQQQHHQSPREANTSLTSPESALVPGSDTSSAFASPPTMAPAIVLSGQLQQNQQGQLTPPNPNLAVPEHEFGNHQEGSMYPQSNQSSMYPHSNTSMLSTAQNSEHITMDQTPREGDGAPPPAPNQLDFQQQQDHHQHRHHHASSESSTIPLPIPTVNIDELVRVRKLGEGAQGHVDLYRHPSTGKQYAVKTCAGHTRSSTGRDLGREIRNIFRCNYPQAITLHNAYVRNGNILLVLEHCDGGDLEELIKRTTMPPQSGNGGAPNDESSLPCTPFPISIASFIVDQLIQALCYLHQKRRLFPEDHKPKLVIHRDIKPANIMLTSSGDVKLVDFGVATDVDSMGAASFTGTRCYMAPERICGMPYGPAPDIWAVGVIAAHLLLGRFPFPTLSLLNVRNLLDQISTPIAFSDSLRASDPDAVDFVNRCLVTDPKNRATADELVNHPWLVRHRVGDDYGKGAFAQFLASMSSGNGGFSC